MTIETILLIGSGPIVIGQACEFDYSGTQACRVLREEGLPRGARELEPGDDHDRPGVRRRHVRRAARRADARANHRRRSGPTRCFPTLGGQTGLNLAMALRRGGRARGVRRRDDRRRHRGDPHRRGPPAVQDRDDRDRPARAAVGHRLRGRRTRCAVAARRRLSGDRAPRVHPRRWRHRYRARTQTRCVRIAERGLAASPISEILIERSDRRVEGIRARGDA